MRSLHCLITLLFCLGGFRPAGLAASKRSGLEIYRADCARCHGAEGQGVADKHDEPLSGDRSIEALARLIQRTMPEDAEKKTPADEAAKVAAYIYEAFY